MKKATVLIVCICVLLSCVGCGVSTTDSKPSSKPSSSLPSSDLSPSSKPDLDSSLAGPTTSHNSGSPKPEIITPLPEDRPDSPHENHFTYTKLSDLQKGYYDKLHTAVTNMQTSWILLGAAEDTYKSDIAVVRSAIASDHPEIFWLPPFYATALASSNDGSATAVVYFASSAEADPSYLVSKSEASHMEKELEAAVKEITSKVTATEPYDIELQLHDLLCQRTEYSDDPDDPMIYTSYGALVNGRALCEGYSKAMQLLLSRFGIECITVTGVAGDEPHMWNNVKLGKDWYNLDVTWNDTLGTALSHEYFNITDSAISWDHTVGADWTELPPQQVEDGSLSFNIGRKPCLGTEFNFFNRSGHIFFSDKISALAAYLVRNPADTVEVRFSDTKFRDLFEADTEKYVISINETLLTRYPDFKKQVSGVSVSTLVLRLYLSDIELLPDTQEPTDEPSNELVTE